MNVKSVEKQEKSTVELVIEIGKEEFEAAVEKVYKERQDQRARFPQGQGPPEDHRGHVRLRRVL